MIRDSLHIRRTEKIYLERAIPGDMILSWYAHRPRALMFRRQFFIEQEPAFPPWAIQNPLRWTDLEQSGALQRCPPPCRKHKPLDCKRFVQPSILHVFVCSTQYPYPSAWASHFLMRQTRVLGEGFLAQLASISASWRNCCSSAVNIWSKCSCKSNFNIEANFKVWSLTNLIKGEPFFYTFTSVPSCLFAGKRTIRRGKPSFYVISLCIVYTDVSSTMYEIFTRHSDDVGSNYLV